MPYEWSSQAWVKEVLLDPHSDEWILMLTNEVAGGSYVMTEGLLKMGELPKHDIADMEKEKEEQICNGIIEDAANAVLLEKDDNLRNKKYDS